jgi:hypothetical protein
MQMQRLFLGFLVPIIVTIIVTIILPLLPCIAQDQDNDSSPAQGKQLRFRVVHTHFGNNCAGYLFVSQESVRYEALVPDNYKNHSFQIQRAAITAVQPWILMGQVQNIVEIKTARATYHFWVLRRGTDLNAARSSNLNAIAAPAKKLIAAIRDPKSMLQQVAAKAPAPDADAGSAANADAGGNAPSAAAHKTSARRSQPAAGGASSNDSSAASDAGRNTQAAEAAHKLPAGALEGIYVGFGLERSHMGHRDYYFTADGWVINNIPLVNMDNFDMTAYRNDPSNKLFIGRYRVDGNQIHIVWANNADRRDVIKYSETAASPGIDTYIPTCRCTGKRFSGKYHWSSPTDERFVQFFPDGTFFDHGLIDQVVGEPNPHGYAGITDPPRNFRGTYSVRNQRLTFNFADGKQSTVAFIAPKALENASKFEWIGVGHGSGVPGAETVIVLMLYEEHYQVQP